LCSEGGVMRRTVFCLSIVWLMTAIVACGNDDVKETDVADQEVSEVTEIIEEDNAIQPTNCVGMDGEPCTDGDPCKIGEGVCLADGCFYEDNQILVCDTPPDGCSESAGCSPDGCLWQLAEGFCRIDDGCVSAGTENPDNQCSKCDPVENRGDWSPVSGSACTPPDNPCATVGKCQSGFCVAEAAGEECAGDGDCLALDDGDACNGGYTCEDCACVFDPASVVLCDGEGETDCALSACNPDSGECELTPVEDGTGCEDGDPCTSLDYCVGGECTSGQVAPPVWKSTPDADTAYITALAVNGSNLYAVGSGGVVYRSADLGLTFSKSDVLAEGGDLADWLFVVGDGTANILALFGETLIVSNNSGITYGEKLTGCQGLAQAALTSNVFVAVCNQQIYLSNDYGVSWQGGGSVPFGGNAQVSAFAATDGQTFYLGTRDEDAEGRGYVYRSTDGGSSWSAIDPPDRPDLASVARRGLFISSKVPDKLFLGYESATGNVFEFGQVPLFRSEDGGNTFTPLNATLQGKSWVPVALDVIGRLLVGIDDVLARGGNYGTGPWGPIQKPVPAGDILFHTITNAVVMPGNDFSFFVPAGNGVALAVDLGTNWKLYNKGLNGPVFSTIASCAGGANMFAIERFSNGIFRSLDDGQTWGQLTLPPAADGMTVSSLFCSPATGNGVYAFTAEGGLLFSNNGGTSFSFLDETNGPVLASHNAMASFPDSPTRVLVSRLGMGLFLTEDGGSPQGAGYSPVELPEAYVASVATDPFDNGRFYVGTIATPESPRARIYVCTDFGSSCSMQKQSAEIDDDAPQTEYRVTVDPSVSGRVFAALSGETAAIVYSTDSGNSWQDFVSLPMLSTRGGNEVLADPDSAGSVFASFWLHGLYYYDQLTGEWLHLDDAPAGISSLAWDPTNGVLLAGSGMAAKLHSSADGGTTWVVAKDFGQTDYQVARVEADGDYLFVLLQAKVHNSTKLFVRINGKWTESVIGTSITSVASQQPENETVLATGKFGGLYLSEDGGETFAPFGSLDSGALDITVSPAEPLLVLAAVSCGQLSSWYDPNQTQLGGQCGIRRSQDGGLSWVTALSTSAACTRVIPAPAIGGMWYATCPGSGVYYSTDDGSNWSAMSGYGYLDEVNTISATAGNLYFGTNSRGLTRATLDPGTGLPTGWDAALSESVRQSLPVSAIRVELQPNNSSRVFIFSQPGGLVRTDNFGSEWLYAGGRLAPEEGTAVAGAQWPAMVPRMVHSNQDYQLWTAVAGKGIFVSQDGGDHWLFSSGSSLPVSTSHPVDLVADEGFANFVWLASREGFFRTSDLGGLWQKIETGLGKGPLEAVLPPNNNSLYVSVAGAGLYSVPFDGAAWTKSHSVNFIGSESAAWNGRRLALWHFPLGDPAAEKTYLVGMDPSGLFKTIDGGVSFQQVGEGLPAGRVMGLARSPHDAQLILAGTPRGVYASVDGGDSFAPFGEFASDGGLCFSFGFDAESETTIYALCATGLPHGLSLSDVESSYGNRVLYVTRDGGVLWEQAGAGIANGKRPVAVLADPDIGDIVYIPTHEGGVLRSLDGGETFVPWSLGLPAPFTGGRGLLHSAPMAFTPNGENLVLGTEGFGMYTRVLGADCE
jgi:photosystem II stability/assembly factor-like uncharacterized protein